MDFQTPEKYFSFIRPTLPSEPRPTAALAALLASPKAASPRASAPQRPTLTLPRGIQRANT